MKINLINSQGRTNSFFRFFMTFCLVILSMYSKGQVLNCDKFKNGVFKLIDKEVGSSFIIRNGNMQSEITEGKKDTMTFIVKWVDNCTYTLTPTSKTLSFYSFLPPNAMLTVTIIETKENAYLQKSTSNFQK